MPGARVRRRHLASERDGGPELKPPLCNCLLPLTPRSGIMPAKTNSGVYGPMYVYMLGAELSQISTGDSDRVILVASIYRIGYMGEHSGSLIEADF